MAAKTVKGLKSEVTKLKEQIAKAKAKATAAKAKAAAKKAEKAAKPPKAKKPTVVRVKSHKNIQARIDAAMAVIAAAQEELEEGVSSKVYAILKKRIARLTKMITSLQQSAKKLTIYKVRLMLDEQQIGVFGPYATIRAASADAKNILRMHVGPGFKIEEIGVDEPVLRSDGKIMAYFHPSIYSAQGTDKGVLTAQVIEQGGEAQRTKTFVKKYNPAKRTRRANPHVSFKTRSGQVISFDAKKK